MFTGLIEATGHVARVDATAAGRRLRVATPIGAELRPGDSIAVSGVCLTVIEADANGFAADVAPETLRVTTLGGLAPAALINLERPLRAADRLGGHFVLGHVDGVGRITARRPQGDAFWLEVGYEPALAPGLVLKGSVAVDGISLTIASLTPAAFGVQLVPFTLAHTSLGAARVGDAVNLETDIIGKHVARLAEAAVAEKSPMADHRSQRP